MSEKLPKNQSNEEVDLILIFNLIGKSISKAFNAILSIFQAIFRGFIYLLKPIVSNIKLITIVVLSSFIIGYVLERFNEPVYYSDMLVKPYFESKYQLANNVNYFNALIGSENYVELSNIFEIDTLDSQSLISFEMEIGPETQNDLLQEYDDYVKSIDSILAADVSYEDFLENRDILSGNIFSVKARSYKNDIFVGLEKGFQKTFENNYSKKLKKIQDSTLIIERDNYMTELKRVDSLQKIYIDVLVNESKRNEASIGQNGLFPLTQEKSVTKEYELFQEGLKLRRSLKAVEEKLIEESEYYDILAGFEAIGSPEKSIRKKYSIVLSAMSFIVMAFIFIVYKVFNFIKDYE